MRIDSEFFATIYLQIIDTLSHVRSDKLSKITTWITQGPNPSFVNYENIPCLTGRNICDGRVTYEDADYVSDNEYNNYKRFQIRSNDTLITLKGKGSIGKIGFVTSNRTAIFSRNIGVVRPIKDVIDPAYLNAYILSYYGHNMVLRGETGGTGQSTLTCSYIKSLDIPRFNIEAEIGAIIRKSEKVLQDAKCKFLEAEQFLVNILSVDKLFLRTKNTTVKMASQSFKLTDRLDAEYYQPKYDELFERLKPYQTKRLSEIVSIQKSIEPGSEAYENNGIPFIRVSNLTKFGFTDTDIYLSSEKYKDVIRPKKDTILLSKDGSVGIAYKVDSDMDIITSGAILHLSLTDRTIMPDYLTLVLNSIVVKMQAERDAGGSIIQHWKPSEIENVIIPILEPKVQQEIANKVRDSFKLRSESERLLNLAKTAVEVAIEQGENKALELLNSEIS